MRNFVGKNVIPVMVSTIAGVSEGYVNGVARFSKLNAPFFGALDASKKIMYISDFNNNAIRTLDLSTNVLMVDTLCKSGYCSEANREVDLDHPTGIAFNSQENVLYISDTSNHIIRKVDVGTKKVEVLCGYYKVKGRLDGVGAGAQFAHPDGLAFDSVSKTLYVADCNNHAIRKISLQTKQVKTLCGTIGECGYADGEFQSAKFNKPCNLVLNSLTEELYVVDNQNHVIRLVSLKKGTVSTLCGVPQEQGSEDGDASQAKFNHPEGIALDTYNNCLYVTDWNHVLKKITLEPEVNVTTLCGWIGKVGSADGLEPSFHYPNGIVIDFDTQYLYIMDFGNHLIRRVLERSRIIRNNLIKC